LFTSTRRMPLGRALDGALNSAARGAQQALGGPPRGNAVKAASKLCKICDALGRSFPVLKIHSRSRHFITSEQLAARGTKIRWPSHAPPPPLQPPPLRATGMEERRRLSNHRAHVDWRRPKLPGQIGVGPTPTHAGPAAQEAIPVAQTRIAWPSSGTDMNRVAAAR
jgi:hypothetical protein